MAPGPILPDWLLKHATVSDGNLQDIPNSESIPPRTDAVSPTVTKYCSATNAKSKRSPTVHTADAMAEPLTHPAAKPFNADTTAAFQSLVEDLRSALGKDGITSSETLPERLQARLKTYPASENGWKTFAFRDDELVFTRNLVDRGNGNYNLLVLVWTPGRESPIHDHVNSHCIMKILQGSLTETRYAWPPQTAEAPMQITQQTTFATDAVTYMADDLGLHKISNPDRDGYAVSMHLYTPPNAANEGCTVFEEGTGEATHVTVYNYYSEEGIKNAK